MVYGGDGVCVSIPGQVHIPAKARVRSYPLVEKDAMLWIWMGDAARADASHIVDYPYHNDTANWPHKHTMYPIAEQAYHARGGTDPDLPGRAFVSGDGRADAHVAVDAAGELYIFSKTDGMIRQVVGAAPR